MNTPSLFAPVFGAGIVVILWGRRLLIHLQARRKIRLTLEKDGTSVTRIQRFNGFLDCGSIQKALSSEPYTVNVVAKDGVASELLCLVRYIPIVGFVRGVEIWWTKSAND